MCWFDHHLFADGEPIKLPESLESLPKSDHFPSQRHRWNTNEVSVGTNRYQTPMAASGGMEPRKLYLLFTYLRRRGIFSSKSHGRRRSSKYRRQPGHFPTVFAHFMSISWHFCRICTFRIWEQVWLLCLDRQMVPPLKKVNDKKGWNKTGEMLYFVCCV